MSMPFQIRRNRCGFTPSISDKIPSVIRYANDPMCQTSRYSERGHLFPSRPMITTVPGVDYGADPAKRAAISP